MERLRYARTLTIGEAARRLNISQQTLRTWCDRGLVEYLRLPSGYRRFTEEHVVHAEEAMQRGFGQRTSQDLPIPDNLKSIPGDVPPLVARFDALRARFAVREFDGCTAELLNEAREERVESR
jgi:excisionase family DNA binding protein